MSDESKLNKITEIAHKMKSGEIQPAVSYNSIEEFIKALKDNKK